MTRHGRIDNLNTAYLRKIMDTTLFGKLVTSFGLAILPVVVLIRDWRYRDRRTRVHHRITRSIIVAWCGLSAVAVFIVWIDTFNARQLADQINDLVSGKNQLLWENKILLQKVDRYQLDLRDKEQQIKKLQQDATEIKSGITEMYEYNGLKRSTTKPGHLVIDPTGREVFRTMARLLDQNNWQALLSLCNKEMTNRPEWLTPYLFAGVAQANLGNKQEAMRLLEYVDSEAKEDPKYSEARRILKILKTE